MEGFILIDKPAGMTSHEVVDRLRRFTGTKTIGHAGTLDPFATGLLLVGVGRTATREMQKLVGLDKEYEATFVFGATSDTDDRTGVIVERESHNVGQQQIEQALPSFIGTIKQIPPAYAAIKVGGEKMYEAARAGKPLSVAPRDVRVFQFDLLDLSVQSDQSAPPHARFRVACGSGTYIRALARDLGTKLGVGGYVEELRRTKIGRFEVKEAVALNVLSYEPWKKYLVSVEDTLRLVSVLPTTESSATLAT